ncbi:hypothetical protein ACFFW8_12270 [Erwinia tracheiphila]
MKKCMLLLAMAAVGGVLYFYGWPWLKIGFAESAYYRQQDKREYDFYTPELLKNMPRITNDYSFEFGNISGPQAFVYGIRFMELGTRRTFVIISNQLDTSHRHIVILKRNAGCLTNLKKISLHFILTLHQTRSAFSYIEGHRHRATESC